MGATCSLNAFKSMEIYLIMAWGKSINGKMKKTKFWDVKYFINKDWVKKIKKEIWEKASSGVGEKWA